MIRFCSLISLMWLAGCAQNAPVSPDALDTSRKTTAEIQATLEQSRKLLEESKNKVEAMQQPAAEPADLK